MDIPDIFDGISGNNPNDFNLDETLAQMREQTQNLPEHIRVHYEPHLSRENFIIDGTMNSPFQYRRDSGMIAINPYHPRFGHYNVLEAITHEIAHKADNEDIDSSNNKVYVNAVQRASTQVMANAEYYIQLFDDVDALFDNMSAGDIMDALSRGDIGGSYGHHVSYWYRPSMVELEIFADIFTAVVMDDTIALSFLGYEFPYLLKAFHGLF